jgi:hypothetical protein
MDWQSSISLFVGIIGTVIAVYQWAVINESKKKRQEMQYIVASINNLALQKQTGWQNQINLLDKQEATFLEKGRILVQSRDDFAELSSLCIALEGTMDVNASAIKEMQERAMESLSRSMEIQKLVQAQQPDPHIE